MNYIGHGDFTSLPGGNRPREAGKSVNPVSRGGVNMRNGYDSN
jgi:hypothetical protein